MAKRKSQSTKDKRESINLGRKIIKLLDPFYVMVEDRTEEINSWYFGERPCEFFYVFLHRYTFFFDRLCVRLQAIGIDQADFFSTRDIEEYEYLGSFTENGPLAVLSIGGKETLLVGRLNENGVPSFKPVFIQKKLSPSDVPAFVFGLVNSMKVLGARDFGVIFFDGFRDLRVLSLRRTTLASYILLAWLFFRDSLKERFKLDDEIELMREIGTLATNIEANGGDFASFISYIFGDSSMLCLECGAPIYVPTKRAFCCYDHYNRLHARYLAHKKKDKNLPPFKEVINKYLQKAKITTPSLAQAEVWERYSLYPKPKGRPRKPRAT